MTGDHSSLKPPAYHPTPQSDDAGYESSSDSNAHRENLVHVKHQRCSTLSADGWGLEILSSFVSLILLGGIISIFCCMKNRLLSDWKFPISLNAIISILTTACSAAIMHGVSTSISQLKWQHFATGHRKLFNLESFDEASRGPFGSVKFLFTIRWNLATIGALVTIFRLGFAPLAQQVVLLEPHEVITPDDDATFGFAHKYDRNMSLFDREMQPDSGMESAILRGIYGANTQPEFTCGGSCRWDGSYISLGFKSVCTDVTADTLKTQHCETIDEYKGSSSCYLTTPAGVDLSTTFISSYYHTTFQMKTMAGNHSSEAKVNYRGFELAKMAIYRAPKGGSEPYSNSSKSNITDCSLWLAAYEYSNARANGSSFSFGSIRQLDLIDGGFLECDEGAADAGTCRGWQVMVNGSKMENSPTLSVSTHDMNMLIEFLSSPTFNSDTNFGLSSVLGGDVDLSQAFQNVAMSMTDYIRNGPNRMLATGDQVESKIFVSIRWYWLIGPVAIELAGLILTVLTIVGSRRSVPLWKSSVLAVLACKHDEEDSLIRAKARDMKEIVKVAENSKVRLE